MKYAKQIIFSISIITIFLVLPFDSSAQIFTEYCFGGAGNGDEFNDIKNTNIGSIALGYTTSPEDHFQFFLVKFDEAGNEEWRQTYGTDVNAVGEKILVLEDGYLLAGTTAPVNQFGAKDINLIRIDLLGNILWEQTYGVDGEDVLGDIILDNDGNFAVAGGSVINETVGEEMFLTLINEDGIELWTQYYGSPETADEVSCLIADAEGNYVLGGNLDGNGTILSVGANTPNINWMVSPTGNDTDFNTVEDLVYFPNGTEFLAVGRSRSEYPMAAILSPNGNITTTQIYEDIFITGEGFLSSVSLQEGVFNILATEDFFDHNLFQIDLNLSILNTFEISGIGTEINALATTTNGDFIAVGMIENQSIDALVLSHNPQGFNLWQQTLGQLEETNTQLGFAIEPTLDSGFVFTGTRNIYKLNKELEIDWITELNEIGDSWSILQAPDLNYYILKSIDNNRFLQKLNPNGIQSWEINLSDNNTAYPLFGKVLSLADGNLLILYTEFLSGQGEAAILKKISPNGDLIWTKSLTFQNQTRAYSMIETSDNNLVLCGIVRELGEDYQGFLAKVNPDGNLIWQKNYEFEESFFRLFFRLYETEDSDLVMIGTALDTVTFPMLFKTDADGNELDRQFFYGDYTTHFSYDAAPISVNGNDQIAFVSTSSTTLRNDPIARFKNRQAQLTIVDQNFDVVSEQNFGEGSGPVFWDMAISLDGKIAAVGHATKGTSTKAFLVSTKSDGVGTNTFDLSSSKVVSIFPNPSNGMFKLKLDNINAGIFDIKLFNNQGQVLWESRDTKDSDAFIKTLNFSFLPKGQYFISISQDGQTWSKQWLKTEN